VKIVDFRARTCSVPLEAPIRRGFGSLTHYSRTILELITDETLEGRAVAGVGETFGSVTAVDFESCREALVGAGHFDLPSVLRLAGRSAPSDLLPAILSAIECAFLDLQGKATGLPVCELLGGRERSKVEVAASVGYRLANPERNVAPIGTPGELVRHGQDLVWRYGFRTLGFEGGVFQIERESEALEALRAAFPASGFRLRFDLRRSLEPACVARLVRLATAVELEFIKNPSAGLPATSRARAQGVQPIALDAGACGLDLLLRAVRLGAIDVPLCDPCLSGGCRSALHLAFAAAELGLSISLGGTSELGLGLAQKLHLACAMPGIACAIETGYHHLTNDILVDRLHCVAGEMQPPAGPGWGAVLDEDKVARYEESHRRRASA